MTVRCVELVEWRLSALKLIAATTLIEEGKADEAKAHVEAFHARLAQTRVLDLACGTGNFLYVALARMKELEGEVLDLLVELGDDQYLAELTGHTITPENFLGIEINPRAAAIRPPAPWPQSTPRSTWATRPPPCRTMSSPSRSPCPSK